MQTMIRIVVITALLFVGLSPARANFEQGTMRVGAGMGLRGGSDGVTFSFSGSFGFYVLKGLGLSISPLFQTGGGDPSFIMLTGDIRYIPFPDLELVPYINGGGGRLFVFDYIDAWVVSAGGGLIYLFGPWYGLDMGAGYRWYFFDEEDVQGSYYINIGLLLIF